MVVHVPSEANTTSGDQHDVPEPPRGFCCAITGEVYRDPVTDREGHTYERSAITQWIALHGNSPITRRPLQLSDLSPNRALVVAIDDWRESVGLPPQSAAHAETVAAANTLESYGTRASKSALPADANKAGGAVTNPAAGPIILEAVYGDEAAGCVVRSVALATKAARATGIVPASNVLFSDPIYNRAKTLRVAVLTTDGRIVERVAPEGAFVDLRDLFEAPRESLGFAFTRIVTAKGVELSVDVALSCYAIAAALDGVVPHSPFLFGWPHKSDTILFYLRPDDGDAAAAAAGATATPVQVECKVRGCVDLTPYVSTQWKAATAVPRGRPVVLYAGYGDENQLHRRIVVDTELASRHLASTGTIPASNHVFGDPAFGIVKQLIVKLQLPNGTVEQHVVREGREVNVRKLLWAEYRDAVLQGLVFVAASYGAPGEECVSDCLPACIRNAREYGSIEASNAVFGNPSPPGSRAAKRLRLVLRVRDSGRLVTLMAKEGDSLDVTEAMYFPEFAHIFAA